MQIIPVDREKTFFSNAFIKDFFTYKFDELRTYHPSYEGLKKTISGRKNFSEEKRVVLVEALKRQYSASEIDLSENEKVCRNIDLLLEKNTYTVTTGQQIHLGLGPLYVAYKTFETFAICEELRELDSSNHYVPVFWMASEDHDLDEIKEVLVFGKSFNWNTKQTGAVGRMNTDGILALFQKIENSLNLNDSQHRFIEACKEAYSKANLTNAFRRLLNQYFGEDGLVIIDGDDVDLKRSFVPVLQDELHKKNKDVLFEATEKLKGFGVDQQIVIRDINLFFLKDNKRLKVVNDNGVIKDENGGELTEIANIPDFVNENAENLSPNAALRPLYQEWILPNLVYVGGGSEVKYWLQLKGVFDNYSLPVPLTHLRSSIVLAPSKRIESLNLASIEDLFCDNEVLIERYGNELATLKGGIESRLDEILAQLNQFNSFFEKEFPGASVTRKIEKIVPKINELRDISASQLQIKSKQNSTFDKVLKTKNTYFNADLIQERSEHFLSNIETIEGLKLELNAKIGLKNSQKINVILY